MPSLLLCLGSFCQCFTVTLQALSLNNRVTAAAAMALAEASSSQAGSHAPAHITSALGLQAETKPLTEASLVKHEKQLAVMDKENSVACSCEGH